MFRGRDFIRLAMRILILSHTNLNWTPVYARHFVSKGHQVQVVSFAPQAIEGIDVEFVGIAPFEKYKNKHMFVTRVPRIRRIIRRFKPDVVFATYVVSNGLSAALSWSGPLVVSARGGDVLEQAGRRGLGQRLRERIVRYVCDRADVVHCVAREIEDELIRLGVPAAKLVQFPLGIDVENFSPDPGMPRSRPTRLICTRKHEPVYDNATIVAALARLKAAGRAFSCTFVGGGHLLEERQEQVRSAGLSDLVTFVGHMTYAELPSQLRQADIYISASLSDGTSSALLEAMATGLVPVVSRIKANRPWIEEGRTGLMFERGRDDELAKALMKAMDDADLQRRAFEENRHRVDANGSLRKNNDRLADLLSRRVLRCSST